MSKVIDIEECSTGYCIRRKLSGVWVKPEHYNASELRELRDKLNELEL